MIHDLLSSAVAWRLGWALLHSLWQILLIGALTGITLALFARRSANERYVIACGGMAAMYVPLVVTFLFVPPHPVAGNLAASRVLLETLPPPPETRRTGTVEESAFTSLQTPNAHLPDNSATSSAAKSFASQLSQAVSPWLPSIVGTWLAGITLLAIWHAAGWACGDRTEYARALAAIEQGRVVPAPAISFLGKSTNMTFHRIQRILSRPPHIRHAWLAGGSALLAPLLMLVLVGTLLIQTGFVAAIDDSFRRASSDGDSGKIQSQLAVVDDRGSGEPSRIESGGDEQVDVSQFRLILTYHGNADKPFYNLTLSVPPLAVEEGSPTNRFVPIDEEQAAPIANWLSATGFFKHARITQTQNDPPGNSPQYLLRVRIGNRHYEESLGWDLGTLTRLDWLRKTFDGEAAKSMDLLLGRLAGQRKVWESGEVVNGLKTTILAEAHTFGSGRPIPIKVYIENVGNADRQYTQVRLNGSDFAVTNNHGRRAPLLGGYVGRPDRETTIKPGESELIGTFDLSTDYYLRRPGRYSVSIVGYGMPPSNSFSFSVAPDAAGDADGDPVRRLLPLLSSQWTLVGSPNAMQKRRPGNIGFVAPASLFMFVDPAKGIKGSKAVVWLWLTDKAAENITPPANAAFTVNESLGTVARWNAYVQVSPEALKLWPSVKEDLKNALNDEAASTGAGPDQSAVSDDDYRTLHDRYKAMILTAAKAGKMDEVARLTDLFDASIGGKLLFVQVTLRVGPIGEHEPLFSRIFDKSRKISIGKLHFAVSAKPIVSQNHDGQGCVLIATNPLAGNKWPDDLQVTLVMDSVAKEDIGTTQTLDGGKLDVDNRTNGAVDATVAALVLSQVQSPDVEVGVQRIAPGMRENKIWLALRNRLETSGMKYRWVEVSEKGECRLNLSATPTSDLAPLKGMPLVYLDASHTPVSDLSPLEGMPLRALDLSGTQVQSFSSLKGMKLTTMALSGNAIEDLTPLRGMKVESLRVIDSGVKEISALAGMPLIDLDLRGSPVSDLAPLKGMKLVSLYLSEPVADLAPLAGMPLETISVPAGTSVKSMNVLREIKTLKWIRFARTGKPVPVADFWRMYGKQKRPVVQPSDSAKVTGTGQWSNVENGLQGRLLVTEDRSVQGMWQPDVYLELRNVSDVANPIQVYWEAFRGLKCRLEDEKGVSKPLPNLVGFDAILPRGYWLTLPVDSTLRIRVSIAGYAVDKGSRAMIGVPGGPWAIAPNEHGPYFLSGTFTPEPPNSPRRWAWKGALKFPSVKVLVPGDVPAETTSKHSTQPEEASSMTESRKRLERMTSAQEVPNVVPRF